MSFRPTWLNSERDEEWPLRIKNQLCARLEVLEDEPEDVSGDVLLEENDLRLVSMREEEGR
jgi:hypothetical protein